MVITGSVLLISPGAFDEVLRQLERFPEVTFHVKSEEGTELVVNLEAEDQNELESLSARLKSEIADIIEVSHVYINFEEEIEKIKAGKVDGSKMFKPDFDDMSSNSQS